MKLKMLILSMLMAVSVAFSQTPQNHADANWPVNTSWVNGVAPGYRPQNGGGLILNIGPGESLCSGTATSYSGGALALTANSVNRVYVDGGTCVPTVVTSGFSASGKPIAIVVTNWNSIVSIDDMRTVFSVQSSVGGSGAALDLSNLTSPTAINLTNLTFAGAAGLTAGGTNQDVTINGSGTGNVVINSSTFTGGGASHWTFNASTGAISAGSRSILFSAGLHLRPASGEKVFVDTGANDGTFVAGTFATGSNCVSSASPAVCGSASAGRFVIAASSTSVVVNTTHVTADSEIQITEDSSLGTALSVTCNTNFFQPMVTARTAGTSFTVSVSAAPSTNPACFSFLIFN